jgi:hypothetical protein
VSEDAAAVLGISRALAAEIMYENDEGNPDWTPNERFQRVHSWIERHLIEWDT